MLNIDLSERVAVVTGASGQLGRVMARTLAQAGADVAVHYHRDESSAHQVADDIRELGRRALVVQADVTDKASVESMREVIVAELGAPDIIVNNAVIQYAWKPVLEQDPADYESQFRSSVLHNVHMTQAFVPAMRERGRGRVIAISTECVMQNTDSMSAYVSGKRGMDGVLRVLTREIGRDGITVNQVAPGYTVSDRDREKGTEKNEHYDSRNPMRRRGTDQEIANVVAFLASDLASYVTGAFIPVCGGNVLPAI